MEIDVGGTLKIAVNPLWAELSWASTETDIRVEHFGFRAMVYLNT